MCFTSLGKKINQPRNFVFFFFSSFSLSIKDDTISVSDVIVKSLQERLLMSLCLFHVKYFPGRIGRDGKQFKTLKIMSYFLSL